MYKAIAVTPHHHCLRDGCRVARWFLFKPKIPIWVHFGGSCNGRCWYILWPFGLFYGHLVYFVVIWYILSLFGIFFEVLAYCTKKNLATLDGRSVNVWQKRHPFGYSRTCTRKNEANYVPNNGIVVHCPIYQLDTLAEIFLHTFCILKRTMRVKWCNNTKK
jgi:hypothetical protein